jgi:REP-associated tyrosine transposase
MDERHLLAAVRYVEMNPVDAGLVERAEDWEWSSARYHLGISTGDRIVREQSLFGLVNDWRKYLPDANGHDNTNYELHLRTGRPLGWFSRSVGTVNRYESAAQEGRLAEG